MVCDIPTINFEDPEPPKNTFEVSFVKYRAQVGTTTEHFYALFVYDKPEIGSGSNWFVEAESSESLEPHYVRMKPGRADHTKLLTLGSATATNYRTSWKNVQAESPQVFGNLRKPVEWFYSGSLSWKRMD